MRIAPTDWLMKNDAAAVYHMILHRYRLIGYRYCIIRELNDSALPLPQ